MRIFYRKLCESHPQAYWRQLFFNIFDISCNKLIDLFSAVILFIFLSKLSVVNIYERMKWF